jgi:hypothetical protein
MKILPLYVRPGTYDLKLPSTVIRKPLSPGVLGTKYFDER